MKVKVIRSDHPDISKGMIGTLKEPFDDGYWVEISGRFQTTAGEFKEETRTFWFHGSYIKTVKEEEITDQSVTENE